MFLNFLQTRLLVTPNQYLKFYIFLSTNCTNLFFMGRQLPWLLETFQLEFWLGKVSPRWWLIMWHQTVFGNRLGMQKQNKTKQKKIIANLRQMIILEGPSKKLPFEYQSQKRPLISSSLHLAAVISFQNPPRYIKQIYSQNHKHYQIL